MTLVDAASGLAAARIEVESACQSLILASPEAMRASEGALGRAAETLRQGQSAWDWKSAAEPARNEASRLETALRRAGCLLASASRYHAGWRRILSALTGGYSPRGEPVSLPDVRSMSIEG
jgi:hypothetical protein